MLFKLWIESWREKGYHVISDGVEYSTSEYKYRKKIRVRVLLQV